MPSGGVWENPFIAQFSNAPIIDFFQDGNRLINGTDLNILFSVLFYIVALYSIPRVRIVTVGTTFDVTQDDEYLVLNKTLAGATTVNLPTVVGRNGGAVKIFDWVGNAGDITIVTHGTEKIGDYGTTWIVGSGGVVGSGGMITLIPNETLNGWLVES